MLWYRPCVIANNFFGFFAFQLFYMTLVVDEMYGHGLSNSDRCESLPKKTKVMGN